MRNIIYNVLDQYTTLSILLLKARFQNEHRDATQTNSVSVRAERKYTKIYSKQSPYVNVYLTDRNVVTND